MNAIGLIKEKYLSVKKIYHRYQRFVPVISFFAGFTWDSLTLTRIDLWSDNLILLLYIIMLGLLIVIVILTNNEILTKKIFTRYNEWYPLGIQFFLGGLFSSYVIFYFQSASWTKTSLFLLVLVALLIANEFLSNRLTNMKLLLSLYFLACFSFFIFFLPVIFKLMNTWIFLIGGILSLLLLLSITYLFYKKQVFANQQDYQKHLILIGGLFLLLNIFYFLNWIPPVPLSMKDSGIYHHVSKQEEFYRVRYEKAKWYQFFKSDDNNFYFAEGDTVFCYVAVFAPTQLQKKILHHWQFYSEKKGEWITTDRMSYRLTGGRDGGYRGYTFKKNVQSGEWRINIKTEDNLLLGRINFDIATVSTTDRNWEIAQKY